MTAVFHFGEVQILIFERITKQNIAKIEDRLKKYNGFSCEFTTANLLMWADMYETAFAVIDDELYIRYKERCGYFFALFGGGNVIEKINKINEYCIQHNMAPRISCNEDEIAEAYESLTENYDIFKSESSAEYIYLTEDLATLKGKKYHAKRNHISAFDRQYNWTYEALTADNAEEVLKLSLEWATDNFKNDTSSITADRDGVKMLLDNMDAFSARGGIVRVDGKAVAFCLGTPISEQVFDINFEKALPEYQGAYAVINREFAKTITDFKYINREDDLGLEGLRRAKLSYRPCRILNKYTCVPKSFKKQALELFIKTFSDETADSAERLFSKFFPENFYFKFVDNKIVSELFVIKASICGWEAGYVYGAATDAEYRSRGYMRELLSIAAEFNDILFLKPANDSLYSYYAKLGYKPRFYNSKVCGSIVLPSAKTNLEKITDSNVFRSIRESLLQDSSAILSSKADELAISNYDAFTDSTENPEFFAITDVEDNTLIVYELLGKASYDEFLGTLCEFYGVTDYVAYLKGTETVSGMLLCNQEMSEILPDKLYLGYALD